ncbi:protein of unknown function, putative signal transduction, ggdef domain protein, partial [mine drainage metagenome]
MIASRPTIIDNLIRLNATPSNIKDKIDLQRIAESFISHGFEGISFYDIRGTEMVRAGRFSQNQESHFFINIQHGATLLWDGSFILRADTDILDQNGQRIGIIMTEADLKLPAHSFADALSIGTTDEFALCGPLREDPRDMNCFLNEISGRKFLRLHRMVENKSLPMNYALDGKTGIVFTRDYRRQKVVAAYAPVGKFGLGMVLKIDQRELYGPVIGQLKYIAALLAILVIIGGILLYWMVTPLVQKLIHSKLELFESGARMQAILDNAPVGIWLMGMDGRYRFMNKTLCNAVGVLESEVLAANHPAE